jgi:hypothetical protein
LDFAQMMRDPEKAPGWPRVYGSAGAASALLPAFAAIAVVVV